MSTERIDPSSLSPTKTNGAGAGAPPANDWSAEVAEIARLRARALALGGPERVARQRQAGKLTVRERLDQLLDPGSFQEWGQLATHQSPRPEMQGRYTAADGLVMGFGVIAGRRVLVAGEDFTVMGGSFGHLTEAKWERWLQIAEQVRVPLIYLFDGSGARAEEYVGGEWAGGLHFTYISRLSGIVPQIGLVLGPCAGDPALMMPLLDFLVMVQGTAMVAAGGPPVVERATGEQVDKETLGGWQVQVRAGLVDHAVATEAEAFALTRQYLSYFPQNAWQAPPRREPTDDPDRQDEALLAIVPRKRTRPYDMRKVIRSLADDGELLEMRPHYGRALIAALARLDGYPVGFVGNQPLVNAGVMDAEAGEKLTRFIELCDAFHLPLIFLTDVPGVMVGTRAERDNTLRRCLRVAYVMSFLSVPRVSVVLRKSFGMGAVAMCGHKGGQVLTLAWPSAEFGALPIAGGVNAAYGGEIAQDAAARERLEATFASYGGPIQATQAFNFDDLIDPRETRPRLIRALALAREAGPPPAPRLKHGIMP